MKNLSIENVMVIRNRRLENDCTLQLTENNDLKSMHIIKDHEEVLAEDIKQPLQIQTIESSLICMDYFSLTVNKTRRLRRSVVFFINMYAIVINLKFKKILFLTNPKPFFSLTSGFMSKNLYTLGLSNAIDLPYIRILFMDLHLT
ncbi:hypothetical protein BpHYR1_034584 [Brachionus plicatilis]|uniref:Uncharacterized protein n=1 Tax=Brachionus plicatilis TaxID=10195 RepID=A0A3M7RFH9_BRAPC|nr:hypothetical protein BpHYR1_034584 [Brachionus plicatilis]